MGTDISKDTLLDYYERLVSFLLQRLGRETVNYNDTAKAKLIAAIALDFANSNNSSADWLPDYALQAVLDKQLGTSEDFDAGKYSASEDGFNFYTYSGDLIKAVGYTDDDAGQLCNEAGGYLSKAYDDSGWTPSLHKI